MTKKLFKKGMSPIIATMLLIALAVSIGATVTNFGGLYYEKIRSEDADCSDIIIKAFELERKEQCKSYTLESIVNFYRLNETAVAPECYEGIATGKGNMCLIPDILLDSSWAPTGEVIR